MESMMSPADVAAVTRGNGYDGDGGWGGGWWSMIILFALIFGWGGNGWGGRGNCGGNPVTEAGLCDAMNFNNLENAVGRLSDNQAAIARQTDNAICNLGYTALQNTNAIQAQLADCCCTTQRAIDSVNFNGAMNTASINQVTVEQTQKILDAMGRDREAQMQNRINQLELQQALCGVVRYPQAYTYNAGPSPFCGCNAGCGCGQNI